MLFFIISVSAADPVYVNTTGSDTGGDGSANNPFLTIQKGVSNVTENGTIYIANGEYTGVNNTNITINRNMALIGQSQAGTVINAQGLNQIFHIQSGASIVLLNLTLKNGNADNGGAILNEGDLAVINCTFTDNNANNFGGAIHIYPPGNCVISGCTFNDNTANNGGAIENTNSYLIIINSNFTNNRGNTGGGAIQNFAYSGGSIITGCNFKNNSASFGGAIISSGNMTLSNSTFEGNSANQGGAIYCWPLEFPTTIIGCNFITNTAYNGGAIYNYQSLAFARYCRFSGNIASNSGSVIYENVPGSIIAECNWWCSNDGPAAGSVSEGVDCTPWLVLNVKADPATTATGNTSKITADVYKDSNGDDHSVDALMFFSGPEVTFTTDLGNVGSKSVTVPWASGSAYATLRADEGPGIATVTAADGQTVQTSVTVRSTANAASKTIGMKETGIPITSLLLAILAVISGLVTSKRK